MKYKSILKKISILLLSYQVNASDALWNSGKVLDWNGEIIGITNTDSSPLFISTKLEKTFIPKSENFFFTIKIKDIIKTKGIELRFSKTKDANNYYKYEIPMFTDYDFSLLKSNEWSLLSASLSNFKLVGEEPNEINYLTVYFDSKIPNNTIILRDLKSERKVHQGRVTITFDDGYKDNIIASEIMNKFNFEATAYIMPKQINGKNYLSTFELDRLMKLSKWDIQYHYKIPLTQLNTIELFEELEYSKLFFKKYNLDKPNDTHIAYPLGKWNHSTKMRIKDFFQTARLAGGGVETLPPPDYHALRAFNVLNTHTADDLLRVAIDAIKNKQWVIFMFHYLNDLEKDNPLVFSKKEFQDFIKGLNANKINIETMSTVWNEISK